VRLVAASTSSSLVLYDALCTQLSMDAHGKAGKVKKGKADLCSGHFSLRNILDGERDILTGTMKAQNKVV